MTVRGGHLLNGYTPGLCSSLLQHLPRCGTGNSHRQKPGRAHTHTATGDLKVQHVSNIHHHAVDRRDDQIGKINIGEEISSSGRITGVFSDRGRFFNMNLLPVSIQLLCQHLPERRVHSLAHF